MLFYEWPFAASFVIPPGDGRILVSEIKLKPDYLDTGPDRPSTDFPTAFAAIVGLIGGGFGNIGKCLHCFLAVMMLRSAAVEE